MNITIKEAHHRAAGSPVFGRGCWKREETEGYEIGRYRYGTGLTASGFSEWLKMAWEERERGRNDDAEKIMIIVKYIYIPLLLPESEILNRMASVQMG